MPWHPINCRECEEHPQRNGYCEGYNTAHREDEKRRRRQVARSKKWTPRLMTLITRKLRLLAWATGENFATGETQEPPTDSQRIRRFRRALEKVKRAIRVEEQRIGLSIKPVSMDQCQREWAEDARRFGWFSEQEIQRQLDEGQRQREEDESTPEDPEELQAWENGQLWLRTVLGRPKRRVEPVKSRAASA